MPTEERSNDHHHRGRRPQVLEEKVLEHPKSPLRRQHEIDLSRRALELVFDAAALPFHTRPEGDGLGAP